MRGPLNGTYKREGGALAKRSPLLPQSADTRKNPSVAKRRGSANRSI